MLNYFVYKVGRGNCWLPLADPHGLYVGFQKPKGEGPAIADRVPEAVFHRQTGEDDDNIAWITHESNRRNNVLLVFSDEDLLFYEVTGQVRSHRPGSAAFIAAKKLYTERRRGDARFEDHRDTFESDADSVFKTVPVRLVARVPRATLYTSIDSLSVYQYLNRGTCRRFWRIVGPTEGALPEEIKPQPPIPNWAAGDASSEETPFAAFGRRYLNQLLRRTEDETWRARAHQEEGLDDLPSGVGLRRLALGTFNPILVETAAFYFCLDLGLLPDVGVGKGLDVVDVRARVEPGADPQSVIDSLGTIPGLKATDDLKKRLLDERVLEVQCKASNKPGVDAHRLLYFGYRNAKHAGWNTLMLPSLVELLGHEPWSRGFLARFVGMQERLLVPAPGA